MCIKVDLPEPDGPVTARNSPRSTSRFTPRSARTSTSPTTYVLTRFLTEMTWGIELPAAAAALKPAEVAASVAALLERIAGGTRRGVGAVLIGQKDARHDLGAGLQLA